MNAGGRGADFSGIRDHLPRPMHQLVVQTGGSRRYAFQRAAAGGERCDGVRSHDLCQTCASLAIKTGANVKVVQKVMGHKTAVLTLDRHGHLYPDDLDAVATAFDIAAPSTADELRTAEPLKAVRNSPSLR